MRKTNSYEEDRRNVSHLSSGVTHLRKKRGGKEKERRKRKNTQVEKINRKVPIIGSDECVEERRRKRKGGKEKYSRRGDRPKSSCHRARRMCGRK
ncbi:hypothetical protein AVEN_86733-1, partial [Araneus ventricosus]